MAPMLARLKLLYEEQHPETKHGATLKQGTNVPKPHSADSGQVPAERFVAKVARQTGKSVSSIERAVKICRTVMPEAMAVAAEAANGFAELQVATVD